MAIITLERAKEILNITTTENDVQIEAMIPAVEECYLDIRNAPFDVDDNGDIVYPHGSDYAAAMMIQAELNYSVEDEGDDIASERIGSYNYTLKTTGDNVNGYSPAAVRLVRPRFAVRLY